MANQKGEQLEPGIWKHPEGKGYLAEINYTDPQTGRRIRERKTTNRLDLAREWRQTRKADALRGEIHRKKEERQPRPFDQFAEEYLETWSKVEKRESTYHRDQNSVKQLGAFLGQKPIGEITRRDVEQYVAWRKQGGFAAGTLNRELSCLKNMLRKAVDWEYIEVNPAWGVKQQREEPPEFEFLAEEEIDRLIEACPPHLKPFVILAVNTGMRRGELFKLEWRDVSFDKGEKGLITIRDTKNGETRYIPMNSFARDTLLKHPKRIVDGKVCPFVLSTPDGEVVRSVRNGFEAAVKRAGIQKHIRVHDLRHTFASHLVMKGVDLRTVAKLLGHRDIRITMRYAHLAPEHLQGAVDMLTQRMPQRQSRQETGTGNQ